MDSTVWQAMRFEQVMQAGRTRPILIECGKGTGARRERARFVTKAIGLPEVHNSSLAQELLGARLAGAYGLKAPRAEPVMLSPEFLSAAAADLSESGLRLKPGLAVGIEFIPDLLPFSVPVRLADDEMLEAAAIYVFDLMIQNPDRSLQVPTAAALVTPSCPTTLKRPLAFGLLCRESTRGGSVGCRS
jgi:hypothetical protein